jgi:hypothetical protein
MCLGRFATRAVRGVAVAAGRAGGWFATSVSAAAPPPARAVAEAATAASFPADAASTLAWTLCADSTTRSCHPATTAS